MAVAAAGREVWWKHMVWFCIALAAYTAGWIDGSQGAIDDHQIAEKAVQEADSQSAKVLELTRAAMVWKHQAERCFRK